MKHNALQQDIEPSEITTVAGDNDYSPAQIRLMVEKWGAPGEYDF